MTDPESTTPTEPTPDPAPTPTGATAPSLTLGQRLQAAAAALSSRGQSAELVAAHGKIATLGTELDSALATIQRLHSEREAAVAAAAVAEGRAAAAEQAVTDFEASVTRASIERVAACGIPHTQLPSAPSTDGEDQIDALRREIGATNDPVKKGQLVAKIQAIKASAAAGRN